jgi:putative flippase GtrA
MARSPLARFAVVGTAVTAVDVGLFAAGWRLGRRRRRPSVLAAEVPALAVAGAVSWALHRAVTFRDDPYRRFLAERDAFAAAAAVAGAVDCAVTAALLRVSGRRGVRDAVAAKLPAVAVAGSARWLLHRRALFRVVRSDQRADPDRPPPPGELRLSVVLPAYGEAGRIGDTVRRVREALACVEGGVEIVVVDDGSTDATAEEARAAGADVVLRHATNRGKGAAVRTGVLAARGRTVAFTDADLAYSPDQLVGLLAEVEAGWDVVFGSRHHPDSEAVVPARPLRLAGGRVVNGFTHAVLLGAYRDTQAGLKAFRSDAARTIFERSRVDGFGFDVEMFVIAERNGLAVTEVPVRVEHSTRSTVRVARDTATLLRDLLRVRRWAREGRYQGAH